MTNFLSRKESLVKLKCKIYPILSVRERNMFDMVNLLWTFRSVQQRMILRDTRLIRGFAGYRWNFITDGNIPKLKCLSRDAVMLTLTTNNTQERQVAPLVNRLEGHITTQVRDQLLSSYTGIVCFSIHHHHHHQYFSSTDE